MKKNNIRIWAAWIIGIASCLGMFNVFNTIFAKLGIPTRYETVEDREATGAGIALCILAVMFAVRIGMAVYKGEINGGFSKRNNIGFCTWVGGATLYLIQHTIVFTVLKKTRPESLIYLIDFAALVGIFFLCRNWYNEKIERLEQMSKKEIER
ncbi:MAG: hypothetical protein ACK53X_09075 [Holosporales bacterium]